MSSYFRNWYHILYLNKIFFPPRFKYGICTSFPIILILYTTFSWLTELILILSCLEKNTNNTIKKHWCEANFCTKEGDKRLVYKNCKHKTLAGNISGFYILFWITPPPKKSARSQGICRILCFAFFYLQSRVYLFGFKLSRVILRLTCKKPPSANWHCLNINSVMNIFH